MKSTGTISYAIAAFLLLIGCAATSTKNGAGLDVPPGLDSTSVATSSIMADRSFVSAEREKYADLLVNEAKNDLSRVDEFWAYLEKDLSEKKPLSKEEKAHFDREYGKGLQLLNRWKKLSNDGANERLAQEMMDQCLQAKEHLETAVRIDPFDKNARLLLSMTYYNLQHLFGMQNKHQKAVEILERLTRIEKGEHDLYRLLGENYAAIKNYDMARYNFKKGMTVLLETSFDASPDSASLFYYAYAQGDAYARLYDTAGALRSFKIARTLAKTPQEKSDVENYLSWINWDEGNIKAAEAWDIILSLETSKNYVKMADLCATLLPHLKSPKAKIAVQHKLAIIEFELLDRKDQAVNRMLQVYDTVTRPVGSGNSPELKQIQETYGAMLYRMGIDALAREDRKVALAYFTKAVSFPWDQMAKAHIELALLLWNNPEKAIYYGKKALETNQGLSEKETCDLLSLLVKAHKSAGLYHEARKYFNQWKQCRSVLCAEK